MPRILVVEDEEDLARGLEINLRKEGYDVIRTGRGDTAVTLALEARPDLITLDVMLPGLSGLDVCRELRRRGIDVPIVMLTAKAEELDCVVGLEIGADDYVTKPFGLRELLARIRTRLRRTAVRHDPGPAQYRVGSVDVDFDRFTASRDGEPVEFTPKELDILRLLIQCRGEVVTRDRMLNEVWGYDALPTTRTVDTHILRLRQKVEEDPANPQLILSIYGEGYKFVG